MVRKTVLAVDIGAESGRVLAVHSDGKRLETEEVYRFANIPVTVHNTLHWDILRLWNDVQTGIAKVEQPVSIGIDTWAIDFGLLDRAGHLLGNPVHYRDNRTDGMCDYVFSKVSREEVFAETGIQILPFNTLYQLVSLVKNNDPILESAAAFLTIPDLLYYWMTGVKINEYTNATTTQCFNVQKREWAFDLLDKLDIPSQIFAPVTMPGQICGNFNNIPVVVAAQHDTGSAVVGVPAESEYFAYLSSGTWSLLGFELPEPIVNDASFKVNMTNEGGYGNTTRFLKNVMGLWLLQESRRTWEVAGMAYGYEELVEFARQSKALVSLIDPDDPVFLAPGDIPSRIRAYCKQTGQPVPESTGSIVRCIFESLALKYRYVLRQLVMLTSRHVEVLHVVGGGSQNPLVCQMSADATGYKVLAGPVEATALGNSLVQLIALGELGSIAEGRALLRASFPLTVYEPHDIESWDAADSRFIRLVEQT